MSDDDDWDTDPDFKNDLTDAQRRAFGNKETSTPLTAPHAYDFSLLLHGHCGCSQWMPTPKRTAVATLVAPSSEHQW